MKLINSGKMLQFFLQCKLTHTHMYMYMYMYREREREEGEKESSSLQINFLNNNLSVTKLPFPRSIL